MEITAPRYIADSEDDSSTGSVSPTPSSASSGRLSVADALPEWQCKYTGKVCPNPRARKTNGKLHRLCEEHRIRANVNQRRLQQKRREMRARALNEPYPGASPVEPLADGWEDWFDNILKEETLPSDEPLAMASIGAAAATEPLSTPGELTDEDVETLTVLFTSSITAGSTDSEIYDVMYDAINNETS